MVTEHSDHGAKLEGSPTSTSAGIEDDVNKTEVPATLIDTPDELDTPPPLDGGGRAWLQVLGSFLVFGNIWGFTFAFGSFQSYYELDYLKGQSPSNISWIGTVSSFLLIVIGIFSGPLFDLGYFRAMLITGAVLETLGIFLLSLTTKYYQIMLCQGILVGLGNGLLYLPGLALVGRSFKKNRAIAMAIVSAGAPTGGIVFTLVFEQLIESHGFAWTVRVMGFIALGAYLISFPLLLWGVSNLGDLASGTTRKLFDPTAFKDLPFWAYSGSNFLMFAGYIVPFIYSASFGQTQLGLDQSTSLNAIVTAQASSVAGRMIFGYIASQAGIMLPWFLCALSSGVVCIGWIGVQDKASFFVFDALYGFFSGALIPLPPSIFPLVCPDPKVLGTRLGMAQAIGSVASLISAPIAGALATIDGGKIGYLGLQLWTGLTMIVAALSLLGLWTILLKRRDPGKKMI